MMSYRSLLVIPLMILLGCNSYSLDEPFQAENGLWGYKDKKGKIRIEAKYDNASIFIEGLAAVTLNRDKFAFINKSGDIVISIRHYRQYDLMDDLVSAVFLNGKWGRLDNTGKIVVPFKYDQLEYTYFMESLARVMVSGKMGMIDKTGKEIIPVKYDSVGIWDEGLSVEENFEKFPDNNFYPSHAPYHDHDGHFSEGLTPVRANRKSGFVDKIGKEVIPLMFDDTGCFSEGLAPVKLNGKWGFINQKGEVVIPLKYGFADEFQGEYAVVVSLQGEEGFGFINKDGKIVVPLGYADEEAAYRGIPIGEKGLAWMRLKGNLGWINIKTGQIYWPKNDDEWNMTDDEVLQKMKNR